MLDGLLYYCKSTLLMGILSVLVILLHSLFSYADYTVTCCVKLFNKMGFAVCMLKHIQ